MDKSFRNICPEVIFSILKLNLQAQHLNIGLQSSHLVDLKSTKYQIMANSKPEQKGELVEEKKAQDVIDTADLKIKELNAQVKDLTNTLKRVQADFENYKKRVERENVAFIKHAHQELIKQLLPILDTFELAFKSEQSAEDFRKGVE